ncbi:ABC transporter ATP-binding protein [Synechococcus sp. H55.11]|uniref:ABC transporter ATP-binding protein n=1 Tax=unclassified Synechococcus TaxID=2626047 RepID=UPI0039C1D24B
MATTAQSRAFAIYKTPPELEVVNLTKRFESLLALDHVSLKLKPGSFHALLGENGAGKSTLVKCIMGFYHADSGDVCINKRARSIHSPRDAYHYGIGMVYQHFTSVPAMTVAENLILARPDLPLVINWKEEERKLADFMETAPFQVNLRTSVSELSAGEKQKVEILKQLYLNTKILILDEPTSVLTPQEADEVLSLLRRSVEAGDLSVLLITHKFREVKAFADEVTVLRRGKVAGHGQVKDLSTAEMAEMMLGRQRVQVQLEKALVQEGSPLLEIEGIHADKDNGLPAVRGVTLTVHGGEIVGIAGVSGNGQRELMEVLAGQRAATAGQIKINGQLYKATRGEMVRHRVRCLPEEPLRNALIPNMSIGENLALRYYDQEPMAKGWILIWKEIWRFARTLIEQFKVKTPSAQAPISHLSGGNVQRVVLARELAEDPRILIAANPCFGLDFAAADYIHSQIVDARNRGVAVLLISEDLDELLKLSDRLLVMADGRIVYESSIGSVDLKEVGHKMGGH